MASPSTGARSFFMAGIEQQIANAQVGGPNAGLIAANFGLLQFPVEPGSIFERIDAQATSNELTGYGGNPQTYPGRITRPLDVSTGLRTSTFVPILGTFMGEPVKTQDGSDPAYNYAYSLTDATASAVSLWGMLHKGGSTYPLTFARARFGELVLTSNGTGEVMLNAKGQACLDTEHGFGIPAVGNSGTYAKSPVLMGDRSDAARLTDALHIKCTSAPALGVIKFKVSLGVTAYGTDDVTVTYDQATGIVTGWAELFDDAGFIGFDECENRSQLLLFLPGDVRTIALNDVWDFPALCQIPGTVAQGGDTTVARTSVGGCRFGPAHVTVKRGTSSADTLLDFDAGSIKLMREIVPAYTHGPGARSPYDMDIVGYTGFEVEADRRFDSREFERLIRTNDRYFLEVLFQGPIISGSTSLWREQIKFEVPQVRVDKTASPLSGPGITKEKVTFVAEQKSDGSAVVGASIRSATSWSF